MVYSDETKIIDPEFVTCGPMGFDTGMLIANFSMAHYAQPGHENTLYEDQGHDISSKPEGENRT